MAAEYIFSQLSLWNNNRNQVRQQNRPGFLSHWLFCKGGRKQFQSSSKNMEFAFGPDPRVFYEF